MIEDVISEVRELFLDEGVDEQVLLELKTVTVLSMIVSVYNHHRRNVATEVCHELCLIFCQISAGTYLIQLEDQLRNTWGGLILFIVTSQNYFPPWFGQWY